MLYYVGEHLSVVLCRKTLGVVVLANMYGYIFSIGRKDMQPASYYLIAR